MQDDQKLVDRIVYLASLASARTKVDPMLDRLRQVTSRWHPGTPIPSEDHAALAELEGKLKNYLVTRDPLREFTIEELERRVQSHEQPAQGLALNSFIASLILTGMAGGLMMALPGLSLPVRQVLAISAFFAMLHVCIVWMYLSALRDFNRELRQAFMFICSGIICFGIYFVLYLLLNSFNLTDLVIVKFAGPVEFITIGFALIYLGLRRYAKLLNVKSWALSIPLNAGVLAVMAAVLFQLPHHVAMAPGEVGYFNTAMAFTFGIGIEALFGAVVARQLLHSLTSAFTSSMRMLYWYLVAFFALTTLGTPFAYWFPTTTGHTYSFILAGSGLLPETLLLYIGYTFKRGTGR